MPYMLARLEVNAIPDRYLNDGFMNVLEDHLQMLRVRSDTKTFPIEPNQLKVFQFDLKRLMEVVGVPPELYWIVMRMNNLKSMTDTPKDLRGLLVPDGSRIQKLHQVYVAQNKIN